MKRIFFSTLFIVSAGLWVFPHPAAYGVKINGTTAFAQPPSLVAATTTDKDTDVWGAKYYFTIDLPATASEPLQQITFSQTESTQRIRFKQKDTFAFEGTPERRGPKLSLQPTKSDHKTLTVTFNPPVSPGKTVTIGLRPIQNPRYDGVYLFGVTAFPAGEQVRSQFLGFGRLQFYTDGNI